MGEILLLYRVMIVLLPTESEPVIYVILKLYVYAVYICFVRCMKYHYSLKQKLWYIVFVRLLTFIESASEGERPLLAH